MFLQDRKKREVIKTVPHNQQKRDSEGSHRLSKTTERARMKAIWGESRSPLGTPGEEEMTLRLKSSHCPLQGQLNSVKRLHKLLHIRTGDWTNLDPACQN